MPTSSWETRAARLLAEALAAVWAEEMDLPPRGAVSAARGRSAEVEVEGRAPSGSESSAIVGGDEPSAGASAPSPRGARGASGS